MKFLQVREGVWKSNKNKIIKTALLGKDVIISALIWKYFILVLGEKIIVKIFQSTSGKIVAQKKESNITQMTTWI